MNRIFSGLSLLENLDLSSWNTNNVTNTDEMFKECTSVTESIARTEIDAERLNTSSEKPDNVVFSVGIPDDKYNADIIMKKVDLVEKEGLAEELKTAHIYDNKINLNVNMYEVNDSITYQFTLKNISNETKKIVKKDLINDNSPYIQYKLVPDKESFKLKSGEEKEFTLVVTYNDEITREQFMGGKYLNKRNILLEVESIPIIIPDFINPETGNFFFRFIFLIIMTIILFLIVKNKKAKKAIVGIVLILLTYPCLVTAEEEKLSPGIDSNIIIKFVKPNPCTFNGELVKGAEYVNGQYTYRYRQNYLYEDYYEYINGTNVHHQTNAWVDMNYDGWGVHITDPNSTNPVTTTLCTTINDIPIVNMDSMFANSKTTEIDTDSFDTSYVKSMHGMFFNTTKIKSLNLDIFDVSRVENAKDLFCNSSLEHINLNGWDFRSMNEMATVYNGYVSGGLKYYLSFPQSLVALELKNTSYKDGQLYMGLANLDNLRVVYLNDAEMSTCITMYDMFYSDDNLQHVEFGDIDTSKVTDMRYFFGNCRHIGSLETVDFSSLDFDSVTTMYYFFCGCQSLFEIDISNLELPYVEDMQYFLNECSSLQSANLSGLKAPNLKDMSLILWGCTSLKTADLSGIESDKIESLNSAFYGDSSLEELNLSHLGGDSLNNISAIFGRCTSLKKLDMSYFNFGLTRIGDEYQTFYNLSSLETIDLNHANASKMTTLYRSFSFLPKLKEIDLSYANFERVTNMEGMLRDNPMLESVNLNNAITSSVTDIHYLFKNCTNLTSVDFEGFNATKVTNMSYMFEYCSNIVEVDLSCLETPVVTQMHYLFTYCTKLENVNLSRLGSNSLNNMIEMFQGCTSLKYIDMSHFILGGGNPNLIYYATALEEINLSYADFSHLNNVISFFRQVNNISSVKKINMEGAIMGTTMKEMFKNCTNLEELNILNMDVSSVTDMNSVFLNSNSIETLDLSGWNTANVTDMTSMFENCSQLETIYISDNFVTNGLSEQMSMFSNATSLVGGNGTHYNSSHLTQEYARIDEPGSPGYFTRKGTV